MKISESSGDDPYFLPQFFCTKIGPKFISEGSSDPSDDRYVPIYIYVHILYVRTYISEQVCVYKKMKRCIFNMTCELV